MGLNKYIASRTSAALGVALLLTACGGGGGGGGGASTMFVQTCNLGCSNGSNGLQVSCTISQIVQNQEIAVLFSAPVDINTVNASTFQIINPANSDVPFGSFLIDPNNPRRVIFRPALTLDLATGQPQFGLDPVTSYLITIPGVNQGDSPPYIMSTTGRPNRSRLQCTVTTTNDTVDLVPGAPVVTVLVDQAGGQTDVPAQGATNVDVNTAITMVFDDIMNSSTLVDPVTNTSDFIRVEVDPDGLVFDPSDRVQIPGAFSLDVDELFLRTTVVFTPQVGLPSAGSGTPPRRIVITFPNTIQDIAGNGLFNAGETVFTTEVLTFSPLSLPDDDGENFDDTSNEDGARSSADWAGGRVALGITNGGSGRHGELRVRQNQTVTLDTDSQEFPIPDQLGGNFSGQQADIVSNLVPGVDYDPGDQGTWPTITQTDGIFEFSSLRIEPGGRLICRGSNPARLIVRGEIFVGGVLDLSGQSPGQHNSNLQYGQAGGLGGANGGDGGDGATRFDHLVNVSPTPNAFLDLVCKGALGHPNCTFCGANLCFVSPFDMGAAFIDGRPGEGIAKAPAGTMGAGPGGLHWPNTFPAIALTTSPAFNDGSFNRLLTPLVDQTGETQPECTSLQMAAGGGAGVYGTGGTPSVPRTLVAVVDENNDNVGDGPAMEVLLDEEGNSNLAPATPPGDKAPLDIDNIVMRLSPLLGHLRGGAGGGGGGTHPFGTTGLSVSNTCLQFSVDQYRDHSAGGGGGGGGAVQVHSGTRVTIGGSIDASGGNGGGSLATGFLDSGNAAPGGGGSGGAVLVQAPVVSIAPVSGAITVAGGNGGLGAQASRGGFGGGGLVRLEDRVGNLDTVTEAAKILPFDPMDPTSAETLSIGNFAVPRTRPESISASSSCWMVPSGAFFELSFVEDDTSDPDPANHTFGWTMDVLIDTEPGPFNTNIVTEPYRGPNTMLPDSFEASFGNMLNHGMPAQTGSPIAVRFQGARLANDNADVCNLRVNGSNADIIADSLTPWVNHPAELNEFQPAPNMIRFAIFFDRDVDPALLDFVRGADNLIIQVQPD